MNNVISISSVISSKDFRPFVQLRWGNEGCQMTPDEARMHAYSILDAANAAETDAILVAYLRNRVGIDDAIDTAKVLNDFREFREKGKHLAKEGMNKTSSL